MDGAISPKKMQKEKKVDEALKYYKSRYRESLKEKDSFLSSLYLDEIAQTLIIGHAESIAPEELSFEQLRDELAKVTKDEYLAKEEREQADLDLEITLRKRFPVKFREVDSEANE